MPYVVPTPDQFKTRFPAFEDAEDDLIIMVLAEAAGKIDQTWREADYQPAILYLAAHVLATEPGQEFDGVEVDGSGEGAISSESFGGISVSYGKGGGATAYSTRFDSDYSSTTYGKRFLALARANFPPIVAV